MVVNAVAEAEGATLYKVTFSDSTGGRRAVVRMSLAALTSLADTAGDLVAAAR